MTGIAFASAPWSPAYGLYRVVALERIHAMTEKEIEETQDSLRRLSQRLVELQETERRSLPRIGTTGRVRH
jgi:hypothetical protein